MDEEASGSSSVVTSEAESEAGRQQLGAYVKQLLAERQRLEGNPEFAITARLLTSELERLQNGGRPASGNGRPSNEDRRFADIIKEKPIKVTVRVLVPVKEHPKFNFVGKLLGPKGNSLKRLQEETMTKMAVLGRGSMRDKHKEEELRASADPKYAHFNDDLHVEITAFAPPAEAHARIAYALAEVRKFLVPDYNDEIRQEQMREMQLLSSSEGAKAAANGRVFPAAAAAAPAPQQQLLLHPAFRGLTARTPAPGNPFVSSQDAMNVCVLPGLQVAGFPDSAECMVFRGNGSILSRLRAPTALPKPPRVVSLLPRAPDADDVEAEVGGAPPAAAAPHLYGLYDTYTPGYGLLEGYTNGSGLLTPDTLEELNQNPDAVNGSVTPELAGRPDAASALKVERQRFRHNPYARYAAATAGLKLPL